MAFPATYEPGGAYGYGSIKGGPIGDAEITLAFGVVDGLHPGGHAGVDMVKADGTTDAHPIVLLEDGYVFDLGYDSVCGHHCTFRHGDITDPETLLSIYMHSPAPYQFAVGDFVPAGTVINVVDNTGLSTGPHLHWGVYKASGVFIDPISAFGSASSLTTVETPPQNNEEDSVPPKIVRPMDIATADIAIEVAKAGVNAGTASVSLVDMGDDNQVGVLLTLTKADMLAAYPAGF